MRIIRPEPGADLTKPPKEVDVGDIIVAVNKFQEGSRFYEVVSKPTSSIVSTRFLENKSKGSYACMSKTRVSSYPKMLRLLYG